MLERLGPELWVADGGNVSFFGYAYPTRMAMVRLESGDLWVWSPIALDAALEAEVRALGPVRQLVSPNKLHHLFLAAWHDRFPEAKLWGTASTIARSAHLPTNQYWRFRVGQHLVCHTANEQRGKSAAAMP